MSERLPEREMEKLLGGYATGTLTPEEREALFAAALGNQSLFDALADEQALKELLDDPASRAHLLAALGERRGSALERIAAWLRRPSVLALGAAVAAAALLIVVVQPGKMKKEPASTVAMQEPAAVAVPAPPAAAPAPAPVPQRQAEARRKEPRAVDEEKSALQEDTAAAKPGAKPEAVVAQASPPPPPPPAPAAAPAAPAVVPLAASSSSGQEVHRGAGVRADLAQRAETTGARDLYYARPPRPAFQAFTDGPQFKAKKAAGAIAPSTRSGIAGGQAAEPAPMPGIRYSLQERLADSTVKEIDPAAPVVIGNSVRVRFEANQEGDLTVTRLESDGRSTPWGSAHMRAGEAVFLPAGDFVTMVAAGEFHFQVRFARSPVAQAKQGERKTAPKPIREQSGSAVYVVNPAGAADGGVEFEFAISAQ